MNDNVTSAPAAGETGAGIPPETVYPNIKYRPRHVPFAVVMWLALYFAPGILLGQWLTPAAGVLWITMGALLLGGFAWRCFFPQRLVADRDGFRIERPDRRRNRVAVRVGYGRIHEANWVKAANRWRRLLGPLVFFEPIWPAQRPGDMKLLITHGGPQIILREDEIGRLAEFVDVLRSKNIMGLERAKNSAPPSFFRREGPVRS